MNFREKYKPYIWPIVTAVLFFILYSWITGILSGEEARVRKFIMRGREAVESKNIFACAAMVSMDYHDKYGNDRQALIYIAKESFAYYEAILARFDNMDIKLDDSKASAEVGITGLIVGLTVGNNKEKILEAEKGEFKVRLIKEGNKWRLLEIESFEPITIMGRSAA